MTEQGDSRHFTRMATAGWPSLQGRQLRLLLGLLLLSLSFTSCEGGEQGRAVALGEPRSNAASPVVIASGQPIIIGVSVPLTGPDAAGGSEDLDAVAVGVDLWKAAHPGELRGHPIEIRAEDDGCTDTESAVAAAGRLLRVPGLVGVLGPECSAGAAVAIPMFVKAGVVTISGSATRSDLTNALDGYFFRTAYANDLQGTLIGLFAAAELKAKSAFVVDDAESYGLDLASASEKELRDRAVTVRRASVPRGTVDFSRLAQEIASANPDVVVFAGFNPEAALLYRQLRDAGYRGPFGAGDAAAVKRSFIDPVGASLAEGVYFAGCSPSLPSAFVNSFAVRHGRPPDSSPFVAHYADAVRVLLDAVAKAGEQAPDGSLRLEPAKLRAAVAATDVAGGVSGRIAFSARGDRRVEGVDLASQARSAGLTGCQVRNGQIAVLFP